MRTIDDIKGELYGFIRQQRSYKRYVTGLVDELCEAYEHQLSLPGRRYTKCDVEMAFAQGRQDGLTTNVASFEGLAVRNTALKVRMSVVITSRDKTLFKAICPMCAHVLSDMVVDYHNNGWPSEYAERLKFCPMCGQRLLWTKGGE